MSLKNPRDRVNPRDGFDVRDVPGSFSDYTRKGAGKAKKYRNSRRRVTGPVLIICAVVSVLVAADYWANAGTIFSGVTVGNVPVGAEMPEEARGMIEERGANALGELRFTGGREEFALSAQDMNLNVDVDRTVDRAYAVGREGSISKRIGERMEAAWGTVEISAVVDYDREAVRSNLENRAARVNAQPRDASVSVRGTEAEVVESREGYTLDAAATAANLDDALGSMSGEVEVAGETLAPSVLTPAAEEAARIAEEAMSEPVVLTADGEEWELSPKEIGRTLSLHTGGR